MWIWKNIGKCAKQYMCRNKLLTHAYDTTCLTWWGSSAKGEH